MQDTTILSIFDDKTGFKPEYYYPEDSDIEVIKRIIFRATLFLVGGADDIKSDRESMLDLAEFNVMGVTYMSSAPAPALRGGNMPIILIYVTSQENRNKIYNNIIMIMETMKVAALEIKQSWTGSKFSEKRHLKSIIDGIGPSIQATISQFANVERMVDGIIQVFEVKCPECSTSTQLKVPKNIKDFLAIPVVNIPCNHEFEVYFTKGPTLRGTSQVKGAKGLKDELKDVFSNI